ncbi:hypothetical protein B0H13DRAFT_2270985 [Mycena leptocephala]|nr:hypothetical protein B0H13DRAFT_2270985 [Mycena leptocephala]
MDNVRFHQGWSTLLFNVSQGFTVLFLYALYLVLFLFSLHALHRRQPTRSRFLLVTAWAIFIFATITTVLTLISTSLAVQGLFVLGETPNDLAASQRLEEVHNALILAQYFLLATNNFVTDLVFLYRTYMIWGLQKKILVLPGISVLATLVLACISAAPNGPFIDMRVPYAMGAATNIILTCFTAGRIWYIRWEAQIYIPDTFRKRYDTAVAIILESGAIYCLAMLLMVVACSVPGFSASAEIVGGMAQGLVNQVVNITPALILVRVGLGRSTENTSPFPMEDSLPRQVPLAGSMGTRAERHPVNNMSEREDRDGVLYISSKDIEEQ